jgi:hypothetical protein
MATHLHYSIPQECMELHLHSPTPLSGVMMKPNDNLAFLLLSTAVSDDSGHPLYCSRTWHSMVEIKVSGSAQYIAVCVWVQLHRTYMLHTNDRCALSCTF